jgi:DNA gyrase inhibitor GyrI
MHSKMRAVILCLLSVVPGTGLLWAAQGTPEKQVTIQSLPSQTVLYTIVRGPYDKLGEAFGSLYGLMAAKGLKPTGPAMSVSLNNPQTTSSEHWLTEIRIPVDESAKELAGTLGPMTDVKTVAAMTVAVGVKPKGVSDPADVILQVYSWLIHNGYVPTSGPMQEVALDSGDHDYTQMVVEIMVPVMKLEAIQK